VLDYSFSDFFSLKSIIERGQDGQPFQQRQGTIDRQLSEVRKVVAYCSNLSDCRRVQLLQFFGEKFDKAECGSKCDNCSYGGPVEQKDLTPIAITAVQLVGTLRQRKENITLDISSVSCPGQRLVPLSIGDSTPCLHMAQHTICPGSRLNLCCSVWSRSISLPISVSNMAMVSIVVMLRYEASNAFRDSNH
jgi:hypothetical protein